MSRTATWDEFDLATMRAAAQGFSPNDWDADPGDPEHGPAPDIVMGLESMIMAGVEHVMFRVVREPDEYPTQPGGPPYWIENDYWQDHLFDMRLERELRKGRRWA
jgi:hypothetical protein